MNFRRPRCPMWTERCIHSRQRPKTATATHSRSPLIAGRDASSRSANLAAIWGARRPSDCCCSYSMRYSGRPFCDAVLQIAARWVMRHPRDLQSSEGVKGSKGRRTHEPRNIRTLAGR